MQVNRKTRNIEKYLIEVPIAGKFVLGVEVDDVLVAKAEAVGFTSPLNEGESLLPIGTKGPACRRNANGFYVIHRDQPMETAYRQIEWHWKEYSGRDEQVERSGIKDVPYKRYPRTFVSPYAVELQVRFSKDGRKYIVAGPFEYRPGDMQTATNTANVLREVLGGFEVLKEDPASWHPVLAKVKRLNWKLLPPGKNPWESAAPILEQMLKRAPAGNQNVLRARLEAVGKKEPDFVAIGLGGFDGYSAFGFEKQKFCILESPQVNNATYILPLETWEGISKMSKSEIISAGAHTGRLVHNRTWFTALDEIFTRQ